MLTSAEHTCEPGMDRLKDSDQCYKSVGFKHTSVSREIFSSALFSYPSILMRKTEFSLRQFSNSIQMEGLKKKKKVPFLSTLTAHYIQETSTVIVQCFNVGSVVCMSKITSN